MRRAGQVAWIRKMRNAYIILVGKRRKIPLGRPRHRWILVKNDGRMKTGCTWLSIGTSSGTL
jgi:hypothetical protein